MKTRILALVCVILFVQTALAVPEGCVIVIGIVREPGVIAYAEKMTLAEAIIHCGGYTEWSHVKIFLIRNGAVIAQPAIEKLIGDRKNDIPLKPWDIISVGDLPRRNATQK